MPSRYWHFTPDLPNFEEGLVSLHREATQLGDDVLIIAGGYGVSTYHAYKSVGEKGSIIAYEASEERLEIFSDVVDRLDISDQVDVRYSIVGSNDGVVGATSAPIVSATDLPDCDVLELDCEGGEYGILTELDIRPREIYVELHPHKVEESHLVEETLIKMGYNIKRYLGHEGKELNKSEFKYMMDHNRENNSKDMSFGGRHPPIIWAQYHDEE